MDWNFNLQKNGIMWVTCGGNFIITDINEMIEQAVQDPGWKPGSFVIIDFREVVFDHIHLEDVLTALKIHAQFDEIIGHSKVAIIHLDDSAYGMGKLYDALARLYVKARVGIFNNLDDATAWIHLNDQ